MVTREIRSQPGLLGFLGVENSIHCCKPRPLKEREPILNTITVAVGRSGAWWRTRGRRVHEGRRIGPSGHVPLLEILEAA